MVGCAGRPPGASTPAVPRLAIRSQCVTPGGAPAVTLLQASGAGDVAGSAREFTGGFERAACVTWATFPGRRSPPAPPLPPARAGHARVAHDQVRIAGTLPPARRRRSATR